jgi:hypothetical protein
LDIGKELGTLGTYPNDTLSSFATPSLYPSIMTPCLLARDVREKRCRRIYNCIIYSFLSTFVMHQGVSSLSDQADSCYITYLIAAIHKIVQSSGIIAFCGAALGGQSDEDNGARSFPFYPYVSHIRRGTKYLQSAWVTDGFPSGSRCADSVMRRNIDQSI